MSYERCGYISAIDFRYRALTESAQIFLPLEIVRSSIARKPDVDDQCMTSWGFMTREELMLLVACEENQECREDYQASIDQLFNLGNTYTVTLYYPDETFAE